MKLGRERTGDVYILSEAVLWGIFPVITILSFTSITPLVSLGWSSLFATIFFAVLLTLRKKWKDVWNPRATADMLWTAIIIGVLFYVLFFFGLTYTSAGNASIIALSETFFSFCLFNLWRKEYMSGLHIVGAVLMLLGATLVLYPNAHSFNIGDLLILVAVFMAPFGNFFQRRARTKVSSESIMFVRSVVSVPIIFGLAYFLGETAFAIPSGRIFFLLLINGFLIFGLSKILWIEGIHRINVAKANAIASIAPLVTLFSAFILLSVTPSVWQMSALIPMFFGALLMSQNKKRPPTEIEGLSPQ